MDKVTLTDYKGYTIKRDREGYQVYKADVNGKPEYWLDKYGRRSDHGYSVFGYVNDVKATVDCYIEYREKVDRLLKAWAVKAPRMAHIVISAPENVSDEESIRDYLWKEYHLDMGTDPENEGEYERLYYGGDLRTYSGVLWDDCGYNYTNSGKLEILIEPRYYATDAEYNVLAPGYGFGDEWRKMLSRVVDILDISEHP
jgi:hypothetical protein